MWSEAFSRSWNDAVLPLRQTGLRTEMKSAIGSHFDVEVFMVRRLTENKLEISWSGLDRFGLHSPFSIITANFAPLIDSFLLSLTEGRKIRGEGRAPMGTIDLKRWRKLTWDSSLQIQLRTINRGNFWRSRLGDCPPSEIFPMVDIQETSPIHDFNRCRHKNFTHASLTECPMFILDKLSLSRRILETDSILKRQN
jgi:hypothetical protein